MESTTTYTSTTTNAPEKRSVALTTLAAVGFVALIAFGMWLAVYSARFVPGTVSRIGSAAVALGSVFNSGSSGVATTTTPSTITFGGSTSTPETTTPTTGDTGSGSTYHPQPGQETSGTTQIGGTGSPAPYSGLPDLEVSITAVGYLTTNTTDSFVAATVVPHGYRPAVKFTIKNIGTNVAGSWAFSAVIPTQTAYIFQSQSQQPLNPGDSIDYTLGFDSPLTGPNQQIRVNANYNNAIAESNTANNSATATLNVQ